MARKRITAYFANEDQARSVAAHLTALGATDIAVDAMEGGDGDTDSITNAFGLGFPLWINSPGMLPPVAGIQPSGWASGAMSSDYDSADRIRSADGGDNIGSYMLAAVVEESEYAAAIQKVFAEGGRL